MKSNQTFVEIDGPMHKNVIVEGDGDVFCQLHRTEKTVGVTNSMGQTDLGKKTGKTGKTGKFEFGDDLTKRTEYFPSHPQIHRFVTILSFISDFGKNKHIGFWTKFLDRKRLK